jgi:glycosyltransferase involved in cell wall biosynthesis
MTKILFTLNSSDFGGMEKTVLDLVRFLPEKFDKFVICPKGDLISEFEKYAKVKNYRKINKIDFSYISFLIKFLKKNQIEIIHANEPKVVFNSLIAGYLAKVPVRISHTHTPISEWRINFFSKIVNIFFNSIVVNFFSTKEISLTESIKQKKINEFILPNKLYTVPNSIDPDFVLKIDEEFQKNKNLPNSNIGKFTFLCLSRLSKEKNQEVLIRAFSKFNQGVVNSKLIIAGKGSETAYLKNLSKNLKVDKSITFIEDVPEKDKILLFSSCNCFVFPTLAEGFGITLLEAMYSVYPVISSDLPVLKEVAGENVIFFSSGNDIDLLKKMASVYKEKLNKKNIDKLIKNKKFVLDNYSIKKYVDNYVKLYNKLL